MKRYFLFAVIGWAFLLVQPADAKRTASSDCSMEEQVTVSINFNNRAESFLAAKEYFDTRKKRIEAAAHKEEVGKLILQNQNYNVSSQRNYDRDSEEFQINGNLSYKISSFDNAIKLAEALKKEKMQVNINSNAYRRGNCNYEMSAE